jgi:hypothetical protein
LQILELLGGGAILLGWLALAALTALAPLAAFATTSTTTPSHCQHKEEKDGCARAQGATRANCEILGAKIQGCMVLHMPLNTGKPTCETNFQTCLEAEKDPWSCTWRTHKPTMKLANKLDHQKMMRTSLAIQNPYEYTSQIKALE